MPNARIAAIVAGELRVAKIRMCPCSGAPMLPNVTDPSQFWSQEVSGKKYWKIP